MGSRLLDKDFKYVPACSTNIRKTFERVRREQKQAAEEAAKLKQQVIPLKREKQ